MPLVPKIQGKQGERRLMKILAIDPGTVQSGWVIYDHVNTVRPLRAMGISGNHAIRELIYHDNVHDPEGYISMAVWDIAVIEEIESYGPKHQIGKETITTIEWIGRFTECVEAKASMTTDMNMHRLTSREVRLHLCGYMGADKPAIRRALLDRFGPQGTKKNPGVLYGVREHIWSALALAVVFADRAEGIVWKPRKEPSIGS
jgi:hypothetical protein